jgi:hypothetical protein
VADLAAAYERRYPDTGVGAAQAQERQERLAFREERESLRRTSRNRGIVIPADAWERIFGQERAA